MSTRLVLQRLLWLFACSALVLSCASTPAPTKTKKRKRSDDSELTTSKRKKKKPKKKVVVAEVSDDEDEEEDKDEDEDVPTKDTSSDPREGRSRAVYKNRVTDEKPKSKREIKAERDRERKERLEAERENRKEIDEENKREAKRAREEDDEDEDADEDDEETGDAKKREAEKKLKAKKDAEAKAKADREAKAEAAREAKAEAARKAKEEKEAKAEAARKAKEEREEKARLAKEEKEEKARKAKEEREAKAEAARKAKEKAKKGGDEDEDEDEEEEDADEEETKTASKAKDKPAEKAKAKPAEKAKAKPADDEEEEDEEETKTAAKDKPADKAKGKAKPADDDDEEEDSPPAKPANKAVAKSKPVEKSKVQPVEVDDAEIDMTGGGPVAAAPKKEAEEEEEEDSEPAKEFDESSDDPLAEKRVAAISVPGVDGEPTESDTGPATPLGVVPLISRPLTLGKGHFEAHGGLRHSKITTRDPVAMTTNASSSEGLMLGGTYGLSDKAEVGFDYTLGLSPGSIQGPFSLRAAYSAKRSGKIDIAFAGAFGVDYESIPNSTTMMTTTLTNAGLQLGFWLRYQATPKVSVFTGSPALPTASPVINKQALPLPPFPYQVVIGLNNKGQSAIEVPFGIGVQPIPAFYAFASVNITHVSLAYTQSAFLFGDFIPVVLGGFYSLKKMDIGFMFSDDLKQGTDYLRFDAMLRYSIR